MYSKLLSIICLLVFCEAILPMKDEEKMAQFKSIGNNDIQIVVGILKNNKHGYSIPIFFKVINSGKDEALISYKTSDVFPFAVIITDNKGNHIPLTRYGKKLLKPVEIEDVISKGDGSYRQTIIRPGEFWEKSIPNLALFFDLTVPQDYILSATRSISIIEKKPSYKIIGRKDLKISSVLFEVIPSR